MPEWRTFSTEPGPDTGARGRAPATEDRLTGRTRALALAAVLAAGGAGLLAASAGLAAVLLGSAPAEPPPLGQPLDGRAWPGAAGPDAAAAGSDAGAAGAERWVGADELVVDVAGAVMEPGLQRLPGGARVGDAIHAAGGFGPRADLDAASRTLNLAQPLQDGAKVLVPGLDTGTAVAADPADARIDINAAAQTELETLPGIGPVTARRIVDARRQRPFDSVRDLYTREVVGQALFEDIRDLVRVTP